MTIINRRYATLGQRNSSRRRISLILRTSRVQDKDEEAGEDQDEKLARKKAAAQCSTRVHLTTDKVHLDLDFATSISAKCKGMLGHVVLNIIQS